MFLYSYYKTRREYFPVDKTVKWVSKLENARKKGLLVSPKCFNNQDEMFAVSEHEDLRQNRKPVNQIIKHCRVTTGMVTTLEDFTVMRKRIKIGILAYSDRT